MIVYLDASAVVKRYTHEVGGAEVATAIAEAEATGTSMVSGAEVPAVLAKAVRTGALEQPEAQLALADFWRQWQGYARVDVSEGLVRRAAELAWRHGLRGYDAVHLASALELQDRSDKAVVLATFDRQLARAARELGMDTLPADLDGQLGRQG